MRLKILFMSLLIAVLSCNVGYTQEEAEIYSMAVKAAKSGNIDFAFMQLHYLLTNYPESKYKEDVLFAVAEYYFLITDYPDATRMFIRLISDYPDSKVKPFALAYLLKMAEKGNKESVAKDLKNEIVTLRQLSFLFRDFKEYKYESLLYRHHSVIYYIDKVEFYVNGELFAKISY